MQKNLVEQVFSRNIGSQQFYQRAFCENLIYTEGIMDFQKTLSAYWVVDNIISHLPNVIKTYKATEDGFFVIKIKVKKDSNGYLEIFREGYVDNVYHKHIKVVKQSISYIDLPQFDYKFYLILSNVEPIKFTLLLPSEY